MIVEILNKVKRLYTAFNTNDRIAKIDALGLPSGKIVPNGTDDWTSARAGYLTTINSRLPASTIASSSEVAKVGDGWNQALATRLAALNGIATVKLVVAGGAGALYPYSFMSGQTQVSISDSCNFAYPTSTGVNNLYADGQQGFRTATRQIYQGNNPDTGAKYAANTFYNVVNISGGGFLLAAFYLNADSNQQTNTVSFKITVDGIAIYDSYITTSSIGMGKIPLGYPYGTPAYPTMVFNPLPVRFNTSLLIQVKETLAPDVFPYAACQGKACYILD